MIVMVVFMVVFINNQKEDIEGIADFEIESRIDTINRKQKKINDFLNDNSGLFTEGFQRIFEKLNLVSYIELPLEVGDGHNEYPFGNGSSVE